MGKLLDKLRRIENLDCGCRQKHTRVGRLVYRSCDKHSPFKRKDPSGEKND